MITVLSARNGRLAVRAVATLLSAHCQSFSLSVSVCLSMVYGELGRYPLQINCYIRVIKYWFRLLKMDPKRLPNQAYHMLRSLDSCGKCNWVSSVRSLLQSVGFGDV